MTTGPDTDRLQGMLKHTMEDVLEQHEEAIKDHEAKKSLVDRLLRSDWFRADMVLVGGIVFVLTIMVTGTPLGTPRLANAEELNNLEQTTALAKANAEAIKAIAKSVESVASDVSDINESLKGDRRNKLTDNICLYTARRNKETDYSERGRLLTLIEGFKAEYERLFGRPFNMSDC